MPYRERTFEEILAAYESWLKAHPFPDKPTVTIGGESFSPRRIVEGIQRKDPLVVQLFVESVVDFSKRNDLDIVERIESGAAFWQRRIRSLNDEL